MKQKNNCFRRKVMILMCLMYLSLNKIYIYAGIGDTKLITGTIKLINDLTTSMLVISPIAGGLLALYFFLRKNAADEGDQKQWNRRLYITGVCIIGSVVVSGLISTVTGYYK